MAAAGATMAQSLNTVASDIIPLLNALSAKPDPQSQASAASLTRVVNALITDAMQANALSVEAKLSGDAAALRRLNDLTSQADSQATKLAQSEANVTKFVSFATHIGNVVVSVAGGNIAGAASGLLSACGDLGISTI